MVRTCLLKNFILSLFPFRLQKAYKSSFIFFFPFLPFLSYMSYVCINALNYCMQRGVSVILCLYITVNVCVFLQKCGHKYISKLLLLKFYVMQVICFVFLLMFFPLFFRLSFRLQELIGVKNLILVLPHISLSDMYLYLHIGL